MSEELKPCPFCGGVAERLENDPLHVCCSSMGYGSEQKCSNESFYSSDAWQQRPIEDALRARVAELESDAPFAAACDRIEALEAELAAATAPLKDGDWAITPEEWRAISALSRARLNAIDKERLDLRAELAALRAAEAWVPVSERLPETPNENGRFSDEVLVSENGFVSLGVYASKTCSWWSFGEEINPDHWRPLPVPPEVKP